MALSIFDLFTIGIGPSSSHTVGPMRAAAQFIARLHSLNLFELTERVKVDLHGSLALTGIGHGTDKAILLGLEGHKPDTIDIESVDAILARIKDEKQLKFGNTKSIPFAKEHINFDHIELPHHPNGMRFTALNAAGQTLDTTVYYSVGGGFIAGEATIARNAPPLSDVTLPYDFHSGDELLDICQKQGMSISDIVRANELVFNDSATIDAKLDEIWDAMASCVTRGCKSSGILPGLGIKRRAPIILAGLHAKPEASLSDPLTVLDWVSLYALAVNEENAMGGRVVTAPTNGAAGILPAVLHYYVRFVPTANKDGIRRFLMTAGAIGLLYKRNASISGAEVGCQGEVGVACSMAAGALTEVLGGTVEQVENAAEIGMEHNLGLTCDPVGGLVQVPCIERNAMGAVKAIHASRLALKGDGKHFVSLDKVIETMRETGKDMQYKYKETALGGLASSLKIAVNLPEC